MLSFIDFTNMSDEEKFKLFNKNINELEILIELLYYKIDLNEEQEELLDKILFEKDDKNE